MSTTPLLSNVPFLVCLPLGLTVLDSTSRIIYTNGWMRERLAGLEMPRELNDLMSWGDADWRSFLRELPAVTARAHGDFWLRLGSAATPGMQVTVSFHRLNAPLDDSTVMVISDISAVRIADERAAA